MSAKTTKNVIFPLFFTGETPPVAILSGAVEKRRNRSAPTGAPPLTKGTVHIPFIIGKKRGKVKYSGEGASGSEPVFRQRDEAPSPPSHILGAAGGPCPSGGRSNRRSGAVSVPVGPFCQNSPSAAFSPPSKARRTRPYWFFEHPNCRTGMRAFPLKGPFGGNGGDQPSLETRKPLHPASLRCPSGACGARPQPLLLTSSVQKEQTPVRRLLLGRGEFTYPPSSLFRQPFAPAAFPARRCGSPGRGWRWRSPALPAAGRWGRCGCWRHRGPCRRGRWRPPGSV